MDLRAKSSNDLRWDDFRIPLVTAKVPASRNPGFDEFKTNGAGSQGVYSYAFAPGGDEELYFEVQMPHDWYQGSSIHPHIHWCPKVETTSGSVVWGMEYSTSSVSGTFGNSTIVSGAFAASGSAFYHRYAELPLINMSGKTISCIFIGRVFRSGTDSGDTYGEDAFGLSLDFHYQKDDRGSYSEYIK